MSIAARVGPAVFERHPDYVAGIVIARGVVNGPGDGAGDLRLAGAEERLRARPV